MNLTQSGAAERFYEYTTAPTDYRLPAGTRLGCVRLQVSDLARSLEYYQKIVGLRVLRREGSRAELGAQTGDTVIVDLSEKKGATPVPRRGLLGLYHYAILLPDRASLGKFIAHLAELNEYAGMSDHYVNEAVYLTDPDGLGIEVYADRPRPGWRLDGSNLAMGSIQLDVDDLLKAAGNERWTGAPAGTKIGHVHLYVDHLEIGERFYHQAVGFDKVRLQFPGALFMSAGGYHHHLGTNTWASHADLADDDDARLLGWTIELPSPDDIRSIAVALRANGFPAESTADGLVTVDPWGTQVHFQTAA